MKKYFIFLFVVLSLTLSCVASVAAYTTVINPATDTVFTCDSNPADFNGKTFENLYVLLNGCTNFDSTVIPGEDAFVTLRDITVTGYLGYYDDTYDRTTNAYRDASVGENLTHADHYLNIAGNSSINELDMECLNPHDCNFGIQFPSYVATAWIRPTMTDSYGKMILRGYIDPLVDTATDYYHDTAVASFPDFNINTFDLDFVKIANKEYDKFDLLTSLAMEEEKVITPPWSVNFLKSSGILTDEELSLFKRGYINYAWVENVYNVNDSGNRIVDFANIEIGSLSIANWGRDANNVEHEGMSPNWIPTLRSRGFTTIGDLEATTSFKTDVYVPAPYSVTSSDPETMVLPLYVDFMLLSRGGGTLTYDMDYTKIAMLHYVGNEDPNSVLDLNTGILGNAINSPQIGIANIVGGAFDMSSKQSSTDLETIEKLNFFEGGSYTMSKYHFMSAQTDLKMWLADPAGDLYAYVMDSKTGQENQSNKALRESRQAVYDKAYNGLQTIPRTGNGYFMITKTLDSYLKPGNVDMAGKSVVRFNGQNLSLGDIAVSKNLGSIANWISGSCHFYQHGQTTMMVSTIE